MMNIKNISALVLCCVLSVSITYAQSGAMSFIRLSRDPVSAGMGFAGVASISETAYSSFRNSSVIPLSEDRMDIGLSWQNWAPQGAGSSNFNFGSSFKANDRFGLAIGADVQSGEEYSQTDLNGNSTGSFSPLEMILCSGVGIKIIDGLSLGLNARYSSQKLAKDASYSAFSGDLFASWHIRSVNLTAGVSSIGSSVKSADGTSFSLPSSATVGADWSIGLSEIQKVNLVADADYFFSGAVSAAIGAQYSFRNLIFLRAGYHIGSDKSALPSFASAGLGVKFKEFKLNAAYILASEALAGTLTVGLGYSF